VGGSFRQYQLNSFGRIYTDKDGPIYYNEYGTYTQLTKKFMDDRLKFTGSIRYDKAQNYDGNVSPGCLLYILVVKVGDITLEDHFKPVLETLLHKTSISLM
jgi:outer membrane receptor protein involved in Fe transport